MQVRGIKRAQLQIFVPCLSKFRAFIMQHPPKSYAVLEVSVEYKVFDFSKRALNLGTTILRKGFQLPSPLPFLRYPPINKNFCFYSPSSLHIHNRFIFRQLRMTLFFGRKKNFFFKCITQFCRRAK